jgi:hypothetical protein
MAEVRIAPITSLEARVLTDVVNKRLKPYMALSEMLFPDSTRSISTTNSIQIDEKTGSVTMATFVKNGAKSQPVGTRNGRSYQVTAPNINIFRPITASDELMDRMAGKPVFVQNGVDVMADALREQTLEDTEYLNEACDLREEWMVSKLLTGTITYDVDGKDSWNIATGKPSGNTFTVSPLWSASSPTPLQDLIEAQTVVQVFQAPNLTHGICSATAADAVRLMLEAGTITVIKTDSGVQAGDAEMRAHFSENGMRYLGTLTSSNIALWEYAATYVDIDNDPTGGTTAPYIRAGYIEFVSLTTRATSTHKAWYAPIKDIKLIQQGLHLQKRASFAVYDDDCGSMKQYLKSRPFFWFKRPEYYVSMKVA